MRCALDPSVKVVILNTPNNPTGKIYSEETIIAITDVLKEAEKEFGHPIYIISDEPYRELVYTDQKVPYLPKYYDNTLIEFSSYGRKPFDKVKDVGGDTEEVLQVVVLLPYQSF